MKSMEQFLILALLAVGTHALVPVDETTCDLRTNTCPCSPLLQGTVYIQVMTDASGREVKCLKVINNIIVFNQKKEKITIDKEFHNRLQFIIENGTIKITNLRRNDSGRYSIEVFKSDGVQEKTIHFTLDVKDSGKVEGKGLWNLEANKCLYLVIACCVLAFLLIAVSCCFACREMNHRKQGSRAPVL